MDMSSPAEPKKNTWETILTITPVIMTVLSTLLAGLSSSEMTQAQYHRSLAAQRQSKAGDQWGFYQAKRIRGANLENTADLLQPLAVSKAPDFQRVIIELKIIENEVGLWAKKPETAPWKDAVPSLLAKTKERLEALNKAFPSQVAELEGFRDALTYLNSEDTPKITDEGPSFPNLTEALQALRENRTDREIDNLAQKISDKDFAEALEAGQENTRRLADKAKSISKQIDQVDKIVKEQIALLAPLFSELEKIAQAAHSGDAASKEFEALCLGSEARLRRAAEECRNGFQAARNRFNARRERAETEYNQKLAYLLEVEVHKSSVTSDRHRQRSKNFFYGMLVSQAAVAIASMSLAARQKSLLWSLASVAGIVAVGFSGYVYLYM